MLKKGRFAWILVTSLLLIVQPVSPVLARDKMYRAQNDVNYTDDGCVEDTSGKSKTSPSNSSVDCGVDTDGDQGNKDKIWGFLVNKFKEQGYSQEEAEKAAAGVMGNMWQETGGTFNPNIDHGNGCNSGPAIGLNQWCFGRQTNLKSFGDERGTGWGCLGTQLDFLWGEMESTHSHLFEEMKGKGPRDAAEIFDHGGDGASSGISGFEESWDSQKGYHYRAGYAEDIYKEYTGKDPGTLNTSPASNSSTSGSSSNNCPSSSTATSGGIPSEECKVLLEEYNKLVAEGKITYHGGGDTNKNFIENDLKNCTTDQIECGTGGGKGGVHPRTLRAITAAAKNSGASTLEQWNFNTGHGCDEFRHPMGMASDIYCPGNDPSTGTGASEDCNKLFIYFYNNYDELGITELIWQYPPKGYSCDDPKIMCSGAGDHTDHIHISTEVT